MSCLSHSTCSFSIDAFSESVMEKSFGVKSANSLGWDTINSWHRSTYARSGRERARLTECVGFTASPVQEKEWLSYLSLKTVSKFGSS